MTARTFTHEEGEAAIAEINAEFARPRWIRNPTRDVCSHPSITIAAHTRSEEGPDPLYAIACECGSLRALRVGAPMPTEHATPTSPEGRAIRAVHLGRLRHGKGMR